MLNNDFIKITFDKSILKPISLKQLLLVRMGSTTPKDGLRSPRTNLGAVRPAVPAEASCEGLERAHYAAHPELVEGFEWFQNRPTDFSIVNLKIEILDDVKIYLHDDLLDLSDLVDSKKVEHQIEFILNRASSLEYFMHLRPNDGLEQSTQNDCEFDKNLKLNFVGQHAFAKVRMNCLGSAQQKLNFFTEQNHLASQSSSCLRIKSVLLEGSDLNCKSKIFVDKGLQEVFARQINNNLLLGSDACVSTMPQLEVLSDNVKCKHGATVKTLDEEQLFYMNSRGVTIKHASDLLINGFLH